MVCQNRKHVGSIASVTRASAQDDTMTTSSPTFQVDPDIRIASTLERRFYLAGRMMFMPAFEHARDFPSRRDDLPELPLGSWGPLGFVSLAAAPPLEAFLGDVRSRLAWLAVDEYVPAGHLSRDYEFDANWALYVENYLEGLHVPFVHPSLSKLLDMDGYSDELYRYANLQLGPAREGAP